MRGILAPGLLLLPFLQAQAAPCSGGPEVFVCTSENAFRDKLGSLGYATLEEDLEDDNTWAAARYPATAATLDSQGIVWRANHDNNHITTAGGGARSGLYGLLDPDHGQATGTPDQCDIDNPPAHCLYRDGFGGQLADTGSRLYAFGGYFSGVASPKLSLVVDDGVPLELGRSFVGYQFFGIIDTRGFSRFRVEETDGKIGQPRLVFGDDFILGIRLDEIFTDGFENP